MDLATIIGLVLSSGLVLTAILLGGSIGMFIDIPSVLIVVGGTFASTFIKFPMSDVFNSIAVTKKAFLHKLMPQEEVISKFVELSMLSRKEGLLALENVEIDDEFMAKGINFCVDGTDAKTIEARLNQELDFSRKRHEIGVKIFKGWGGAGPAFGMIGTLVGLVQMLANMSDPKTIGPAMAVAILTTLYGSIIANVVALPIADKLEYRSDEEQLLRLMIIEGVLGLKRGENPRVLEESLQAFVPPKKRKSKEGS